jgi:hypothetical protein
VSSGHRESNPASILGNFDNARREAVYRTIRTRGVEPRVASESRLHQNYSMRKGSVPYTISELVSQAESKMKVQFFYELGVETPLVLRGIRFMFVPARTRKPLAKNIGGQRTRLD